MCELRHKRGVFWSAALQIVRRCNFESVLTNRAALKKESARQTNAGSTWPNRAKRGWLPARIVAPVHCINTKWASIVVRVPRIYRLLLISGTTKYLHERNVSTADSLDFLGGSSAYVRAAAASVPRGQQWNM
jgi:hypothetical protein